MFSARTRSRARSSTRACRSPSQALRRRATSRRLTAAPSSRASRRRFGVNESLTPKPPFSGPSTLIWVGRFSGVLVISEARNAGLQPGRIGHIALGHPKVQDHHGLFARGTGHGQTIVGVQVADQPALWVARGVQVQTVGDVSLGLHAPILAPVAGGFAGACIRYAPTQNRARAWAAWW